jgi:isopenicillin N synthase-like dioxygenase
MYETIHWGYEAEMDPEATGPWDSSYNFYPSEKVFSGFRDLMAEYYRAVMVLSRKLLKMFALGLDLEENYFAQFSKHPNVMLALNYYEAAAPQNPEGSGIFAHSDLEGIEISTVSVAVQADC